jgi:uncharacterized protein YuzE
MKVTYDKKSDLLYIRLDESRQDVINKRVADDVVLDILPITRFHACELLRHGLG